MSFDTKRICKFVCALRDIRDLIALAMPRGAKMISVINQRESLCVYAEVNTSTKTFVKRYIAVYGTEHTVNLPPDYRFLGTVVFAMGELVYHVYDLGEQ